MQRQGWYISLTFINFQENCQTADMKYISIHIMLFHSVKQYVIILSTSFFQIEIRDCYLFDLSYAS